jgi:rod shape determining protein RodA
VSWAKKNGLGLELPRATIGVSRWRRFRASVDWPLIVTMLLLCTLGMLNLYSATRSVGHDAKFDKQVQWMVVGVVMFIVVTVIDYRTLVRLAWIGLGAAVALLLVARLFGHPDPSHHGYTYRWLNIGGMGVQPSELATLMVIPVLARLFGDAEPASYAPAYFAPRLASLLVPVALIAVQPDLGTAVLLTLIVLTVGFLAMPNVWPMVYTTAGLLLAIPILWEKLHTYQKDRLLGFIDCNVAPTKTCWHTMQSIYAVGSGRIWGKGFLEGTQNRFGYVPENLTDFPFARWAEEWGFVGSVALLAIFGFLLLWTINVALSARDRVGSVICVGVAAMTFWHVVVNVAMVLGIAPVVGVTLPFISYGGSSLVTFFLGMGLVANVSLRKHGY